MPMTANISHTANIRVKATVDRVSTRVRARRSVWSMAAAAGVGKTAAPRALSGADAEVVGGAMVEAPLRGGCGSLAMR